LLGTPSLVLAFGFAEAAADRKHGKPLTCRERNEGVKGLFDLKWSEHRVTKATSFSQKTVSDIAGARDLRVTSQVEVATDGHDTACVPRRCGN
jgi:hypothetical protein